MRNVSDERIIKIAFFCSLLTHCLFLGMPRFNLNTPRAQKLEEDITVEIEIERPPLLPKIDVMGEEKKLREIVKEEKPPEPEPEEQINEVMAEKPEPPKEIVEVINPQEETMLRYQDMIKQKIESCRRYPNWAKKQGFGGIVNLIFIILSDGQSRDIEIIHSSGFAILDNEAVATIKRTSPFLPIPKKFNRSQLRMEVAVVFKLK